MHVIDSLALGGAERVAVNLSNALTDAGIETHLCVTRIDGPLHEFIHQKVNLLMLHKKSAYDIAAYRRFRKYIIEHGINVIHAHSSSVFLAAIAKPRHNCVLVWHAHHGKAIESKPAFWLRSVKRRIKYIFTVNNQLSGWAVDALGLNTEQVEYLRNYPDLNPNDKLSKLLPGNRSFKIAHVAGLRADKDHITLFRAAQRLQDCDFYCVGGDFGDDYSQNVWQYIEENGLQNVHLLGARTDVAAILKCCDIGVLSSESEGLPVSLLEYGLMGLPVVCTKVGECPAVLGNGEYGLLVDKGDSEALYTSIRKLLDDENLRQQYAEAFHKNVGESYSKEAVIKNVIERYQQLLKQ